MKARPVHYQPQKWPGVAGDPPLCFPYWPAEPVRHTFDAAAVTCQRCINILARVVEHRLTPAASVELCPDCEGTGTIWEQGVRCPCGASTE